MGWEGERVGIDRRSRGGERVVIDRSGVGGGGSRYGQEWGGRGREWG